MLPVWADVLIVLAIPVILLIVLRLLGNDEPDNAIVHAQEDEKPDGSGDEPTLLTAA